MIREMPLEELDRHIEQARIGMETSIKRNEEAAYRCCEALEEKCRHEKVRRMLAREP